MIGFGLMGFGVKRMGRSHRYRNLIGVLVLLGCWLPAAQTLAQFDQPIQTGPPGQPPQPEPNLPPQPGEAESDRTNPIRPTDPTDQPAPNEPLEAIPPLEQEKPASRKDEFPPNPLELKVPDPLLPKGADSRSLTPAERKRLIPQLNQLDAQAAAQLKAGDRVGAFETWNRELRLRRYLGPVEEVKALGRVGAAAWQENDTPQVRWITERLDQIFAQAKAPTPGLGNNVSLSRANVADRVALLDALGIAYQQVRLHQSAVAVYELLLVEARQRKDEKKIESTLVTLGQLYLNWFNYPKAAETYNQLLARARARKDSPNEIVYLTQLAYIHEQAKEPAQAIPYQEQLISLYQKLNDPKPIPALRIKIADNYTTISRLDLAERNYQAAYQLAQPLLQLGYASDALKKLGVLYLDNNRLDAALRVYNFLVGVEQQAYNVYGMMDAYDQIGKIYVSRKAYPQAITAFQRGLALARQLKYREDYFTAQIQQVSKQSSQ
ncbi:tetratricopeptide repeat protein [Leptothermofonsia sp. ETS-13]|uniref:tetratricopeptide repeat protein n=1 Tax=Leptothermofonsia sp. ETS-13 TaxID=3035696 RepID=UPI003BA3C0A0